MFSYDISPVLDNFYLHYLSFCVYLEKQSGLSTDVVQEWARVYVLRLVTLLLMEGKGYKFEGLFEGVTWIFEPVRCQRVGDIESNLRDMFEKCDGVLFEDTNETLDSLTDLKIWKLFMSLKYAGDEFEAVPYNWVDPSDIGRFYEVMMNPSARAKKGAHFTPFSLSLSTASKATYPLIRKGPVNVNTSIIDTAVGAGALLCASLEFVTEGRTDEAYQITKDCLYGIDIDPINVALTKISLALTVFELSSYLPSFSSFSNIKCGDSLLLDFSAFFPEVMERGGFDAVIANPPFLGGLKIKKNFSKTYHNQLLSKFEGIKGSADLSCFFLRNDFNILKEGGTLASLVTNSIYSGVSREASLMKIVGQGGTIVSAETMKIWPSEANVVFSSVTIAKGQDDSQKYLNGDKVRHISSFLNTFEIEVVPNKLKHNLNKSFQGTIVLGTGFVFSSKPTQDNTAIEVMYDTLESDEKYEHYVKHFIDNNTIVKHGSKVPMKFVIDFGEMTEEQARKYPRLFSILEEKVKPKRLGNKCKRASQEWWKHLAPRNMMQRELKKGGVVLVTGAQASKYLIFQRVGSIQVFSNALNVFPNSSMFMFGILSSSIHEIWCRLFSSDLNSRLRYNPTTCFSNFPFPRFSEKVELKANLLLDLRDDYTTEFGLTDLYNDYHQEGHCEDLKVLHKDLDQAVVDSYGWRVVLRYSYQKDSLGNRWYRLTTGSQREVLNLLLIEHENQSR